MLLTFLWVRQQLMSFGYIENLRITLIKYEYIIFKSSDKSIRKSHYKKHTFVCFKKKCTHGLVSNFVLFKNTKVSCCFFLILYFKTYV